MHKQKKGSQGCERLAEGMAEPDYLSIEEQRQDGDQNRRPKEASGQRDEQSFRRLSCRLPEGDHQDIVSGKEEAAEIIQALTLHKIDQLRILRIKDGEEIPGEKYDQQIAYDTCDKEHPGGKAAHGTASLRFSCACKIAEHRLQSLGHAEKQCQDNKHQISDDQISRQADFTVAVAHNGKVVNKGNDSDAELHNKGREAQKIDSADIPQTELRACKIQPAFFSEKMRHQNDHAENRSQCGGEGGSSDSHVQRKHKHIVQNDIGDRPECQSEHGELGLSVVAGKATEQKAEDQERRKCQDIPHIFNSLSVDLRRGAKEPGKGMNKDVPQNDHQNPHSRRADSGCGEGTPGLVVFAAAQTS